MSSRVLAVACVGLSFSSTALAQTFDVSGACPGAVDLTVTGATANGNVVFVTGTAGGSTVMMGGPCVGGTLDLGAPLTVRFNGAADAAGSKTLSPTVGAGACAFGGQWLDLTTCTTTEAKTLTPTCDPPPAVTYIDQGPMGANMADPVFFSPWTFANVTDDLRENHTYDDGVAPFDAPATIVFDMYDAAFTLMCSIVYDISAAVADPTVAPISAATGAALTATNPVEATLAAGFSDCGPINAAGALATTYGIGDDLRDLFNGSGWDIAYNVVSADMEAEITSQVGAASYAADFDPFIIGESIIGVEVNFAATYERTCEDVEVDPATGFLTLLPVPAGADVVEHGEGFPVYVFVL